MGVFKKKNKCDVITRLVQQPCWNRNGFDFEFILLEFISSKVLHKTEIVIVFNCRLVAAIVVLGYFNADLTFHVYFCKKPSEFVNQNQWSMQSAYVNRVWLQNQKQKRYFFLFSRPSHGTHLDLSSLSSQSSKSVLNDERIVFSCQWKSSIETSKI